MLERGLRTLVSCLTLALAATECKPIILQEAGAPECESNTECDSATVCAFRHCHDACVTSADCSRGRCVTSESGSVCQLDVEVACARNSDCPATLICGADAQCRNQCRTTHDCLPGQLCSLSGECADVSEVDPAGGLKGAPWPVDSGGEGSSYAAGGSAGGGGMSAAAAASGGTGGRSGGVGSLPPWATAGSGAVGAAASDGAGGAPEPEGVPLVPVDGWLDGTSNVLMIQGGIFAYADPFATLSLSQDFTATNACIKGIAPRVDLSCIPAAGSNCYGTYWGSGIGLNLNQSLDPSTDPPTVLPPLAFDATSLKGFSFELTGNAVPAYGALRFGVFTADAEFCRINYNVSTGLNIVLFSELSASCYISTDGGQISESAQSSLVRVAWHVMTNAASAFEYDFCVSNIRALLK